MADNMDGNFHNSNRGWYMPQMGRARELITALQRTRNQDRDWGIQQEGRGSGIRPSSLPTVGFGRARARALLQDMLSRNNPQSARPNCLPLERKEV